MNFSHRDRADVGLLRVAHKTVSLVQPRAFPFALRGAQDRPRRPGDGTPR
jgi:hypothetical protein